MKYKHLFFDLDNTLWDFEKNSHETFNELYLNHLQNHKSITSFEVFHGVYAIHNTRLWDLYRNNLISKEELRDTRFLITLKEFGIDDRKLADTLSEEYIYHSPRKGILFPGAVETLEKLKPHFKMHIITNGFEEIQHVKLAFSGLDKYFENLITSEQAASKKPNAGIFYYALEKAGAGVEESLMIGDDLEVDIIGAGAIGMDTVYFDPYNLNGSTTEPTYKVATLHDILPILNNLSA